MPTTPDLPPTARALFRPDPPVVIGLLGGVAAGKTAVARAFAARGLCHVDADAIAAEVTQDEAILQRLAAALGPTVIGPDGRFDRRATADLVFDDPARRLQLEAITHPAIRARILAAVEAAHAHGDSVLIDAPLLIEGGLAQHCDRTVFVATSPQVRAARAAARGWSLAELQRRERAQVPLDDKHMSADFTIDNDGSLAAMTQQVDELLQRLRSQPRRSRS